MIASAMNDKALEDLKATRDLLFDLYDQEDREELKTALRLVNREIRRADGAKPAEPAEPQSESAAADKSRAWSGEDDTYLRAKLARPTQTKEEAKRILVECSEHLGRTDAETYSRIRTLGLNANLHAWGNKPKTQWRTMPTSFNAGSLPGLLHDFYQGSNKDDH